MSALLISKENKTTFQKKLYAVVFLFFIFGMPINYFLNYLIQNVIGAPASVSIVYYGILTVFGVAILLCSFLKKPVYLFIFLIAVLGTHFSALIYPNASRIFNDFFNPAYNKIFCLYFFCLPALFFTIDNWKDIKEYVYKYLFIFSFICLALGLLDWIFYIKNHLSLEYMTFSYNMLMSVVSCFCYHRMRKNRIISLISIAFGVLGIACILISGARGALLCCAISLILLFLTGGSKASSKISLVVIFCAVLFIFVINYETIISSLSTFAGTLGVRTRTLDFLSSDSLLESAGRETRISTSLNGVLNNPFGYGFYGDWHLNNSYAHNIAVEMLVDFGIIFGPIILVWLTYSLFSIFKTSDRDFVIILSSYGLFQLLFSGSFMWHLWFFMLVGLFWYHTKFKKVSSDITNFSFRLRSSVK